MKTRLVTCVLLLAATVMGRHPASAAVYRVTDVDMTASGYIDYTYEDYTDDLYEVYEFQSDIPCNWYFYLSVYTEGDCDRVLVYEVDLNGHETLILESYGEDGYISVNTSSMSGRAKLVVETDGSVCYCDQDTEETGIYIEYACFRPLPRNYVNQTVPGHLVVGGNVGIGYTSPTRRLSVNGSVDGNLTGRALRIQTAFGNLDLGPQDASLAHIRTDRPGISFNRRTWFETGELTSGPQTDLVLQTDGVTRMTLDVTTGFVGIGTSAPRHELDVKGTVRATEVTVESVDSFPDYVFAPGYRLRPLDEVRDSIGANGHLPDFPSAEQVREHGLSLPSMQLDLVRKVEELTLYVIRQQQELEAQRETIIRQQLQLDRQQLLLDRQQELLDRQQLPLDSRPSLPEGQDHM